MIVRPDDLDDDDDTWTSGVDQWRRIVQTITGNPVEVIEITQLEAVERAQQCVAVARAVATSSG